MSTSKATDRFEVVVTEAEAPCHIFSQAQGRYLGEVGTLAWALAGRAWLHGYEQPQVDVYRDGKPYLSARPTRELCGNKFESGARFWGLELQ